MDAEHTNGMMGDNLKVIGWTIKWKEKEFLHGPMAGNTSVIILMIRNMASALSLGKMVECTTVTGSMESSMVMERTLKTVRREKDYGI